MRYLLTFMLLFVVSIVEASPTPDWVLGRGHMEYDSSRYLIGVGFSDKSTVSASESARAELIKSISVRVNTVNKDYNSSDKSFSEASVSSETDFLLEGSQVKDGWYDEEKEIFYSLVVIERQYVLDTLKALIDVLVAKNDLTLRQGDTFFNNGNVVKALVYYYDGYVESSKLIPFIRTYKSVILNTNTVSVEDNYNLIFKERVHAIVDNLSIESMEQSLEEDEFTFRVRPTLHKNTVKKFPIKFYSVYKHYVDRQLCSNDGCYIKVNAFDIINDKNSLYVRAVIDMQTLEKYFSYKLDKKIFNKLKLISVSFKRRLEVTEVPQEEIDAVQQYANRKEQIFRQMDRSIYNGLGRSGRPDIDLSPLRRKGSIDFNIRFGNGNINFNKRY
jgi:hypothetical protein